MKAKVKRGMKYVERVLDGIPVTVGYDLDDRYLIKYLKYGNGVEVFYENFYKKNGEYFSSLVREVHPNGMEVYFNEKGEVIKYKDKEKLDYELVKLPDETCKGSRSDGKYIIFKTVYRESGSIFCILEEGKDGNPTTKCEYYTDTMPPCLKKVILFDKKKTTYYFKQENVTKDIPHIIIMPDEIVVYNKSGNVICRRSNGKTVRYDLKTGGKVIQIQYKEDDKDVMEYPYVCNGASLKKITHPTGLQYWYRDGKLIGKKYARGTWIAYNKSGRKDRIIYKIMADGTKIFYNTKGNISFEILPSGRVFKYQRGKRVGV